MDRYFFNDRRHTWLLILLVPGAVLELRGGGPGPLSSGSAPDLHYRLALRAGALAIRPP